MQKAGSHHYFIAQPGFGLLAGLAWLLANYGSQLAIEVMEEYWVLVAIG